MSHWDGKRIVRFESKPYAGRPGCLLVDCGFCNGIKWGAGDQPPIECDRCGGSGYITFHKASGSYALYPGGPFRGRQEAPAHREAANP